MSEEQEELFGRQKVEIEAEIFEDNDGKMSWAEKFKKSLSKMFETEDQDIS